MSISARRVLLWENSATLSTLTTKPRGSTKTSADIQYSLGLTLNKLNRADEEILAYRRTVALKPDHAGAIERLGLAYFKQKRFKEAVAAFEQLKAYKSDAKTYNYLGESYF